MEPTVVVGSDEQREALLKSAAARVAELLRDDIPGLGDPLSYLHIYYRHVAAEDLAAIGPDQAAAVAAEHARLGANRPQGRPLVCVRVPAEPDGGDHVAFDPDRAVVDIVTDDMPFLVDSVTMGLDRYHLELSLIVHPQLRVSRDVAGALRKVFGPLEDRYGDNGEINESWIHIEVSKPSGDLSKEKLETKLRGILDDVRVAVEDHPRMRSAAERLADQLADEMRNETAHGVNRLGRDPQPTAAGDVSTEEAEALLRWLADGHFTFLGYREYDLVDGPEGMALRAVPGTGLGILRHDRPGSDAFAALPPEVRAKATEPVRLVLTKANSRSTVHRSSYLDYVAVKKFDGTTVVGEYRFLGLYTYVAYTESITRIPVLRQKLTDVLEAAGIAADSHDGKDLTEILETYPREELFQTSVAELTPITLGVLRLRERKQTRLFLRKDPYGRYMSCLLYMPRDRWNTKVRHRTQEILMAALNGVSADYSAMIGESVLARLQVVIRGERGRPMPDVDAAELEQKLIAAVRTWDDDLLEEATRSLGGREGRALVATFGDVIPETYKADMPAVDAMADLCRIKALRKAGDQVAVELYQSSGHQHPAVVTDGDQGTPPQAWRLKIYRAQSPITLSHVLPQLQHMGVEVVDEHPYEFVSEDDGGPAPFWIYDFGVRSTASVSPKPRVKEQFEDALLALWGGLVEDDNFNSLVLAAELTWRQAVVLRAYARYLRQTGITFSQDYIERVLRSNVTVTRLLVRLFESRFDPQRSAGEAERSEAIVEEIRGELDEVASLDQDRILRAYLALIMATLRTNYYQRNGGPAGGAGSAVAQPRAPYLALKMDPGQVPDLPAPRPQFELFAYSPRFEAIHLRFGRVARGGIRWSDREEDFRTEVLGLVKAQDVKNSVIVPAGAKGAFVCKQLPDPADRAAYAEEGLACYRMFISAMLDITDNRGGEQVVPPPDVVRHDGDDPYLVVAADKGTATFSDVANGISAKYGFWLGDAFASGGSVGYDHKKMGITARGAWESVRYHFRALGLDVDSDEFTVAGIGDMSGDVFGNGMLLSRKIKLVAAFDHRHVFLDPDPGPAASFAERQRLFALPRSSWADYDSSLISAGGGVWPRTAKSVPISPQVRTLLDLDDNVLTLTPGQLISAVLAAPVDLLWNGGIGTYVKASTETHASVGDRSNDAIRIDAPQLRAKVVGEGGNLGLTQAGRIEFARRGGLINTDFIDNSAGVDTSDHEVNIKVLLGRSIHDGQLTMEQRDRLLHEMTDEVAALVLPHNYDQNVVLAAARAQASSMLHVHARLLRKLERDGKLRRRLEVLPGDKEIAERRAAGEGLTSPEFAVLLARTKIDAAKEVLNSELPDDSYLHGALVKYFPEPLREGHERQMAVHPLRREIITTVVVNDMIDKSGITFWFRLNEETGASGPDITRAWLVAREVFGMPAVWEQIQRLDGLVDVNMQITLLLEGRKLTERAARWLLHNRRSPFGIQDTIDFFADGVLAVGSGLPKLLTGTDLAGFMDRREEYVSGGVPASLADRAAAMVPAYSTFDIVEISKATGRGVEETAEVYFDLADRLQITQLRDRITALPRDDRWNTAARAALRDDLYAAHAALAGDVLEVAGGGSPEERLARWAQRNEASVARATQTLTEIWESDRFTMATLSVAVRAIRSLVQGSRLPE
ncbi:MAG TPA: NAD-glutamate dehydrogenase [Streptosporangiaceae bacterium]|nr:NAD-glutamate dehydrogenase [Streptosporangiaceae bacterium]